MRHPNFSSVIVRNIARLKETASIDENGELTEGFLMTLLKEYNIHHIFDPILKDQQDRRTAYVMIAFIILAYSYNSTWINIDKDRYINKKEILSSIIRDSGIDIPDDTFDAIVGNQNMILCECINIFVESQKDNDFATLISLSEHISFCRSMAQKTTDVSDKNLVDRGRYLNDAELLGEKVKKIKSELESKYQILDEVMRKENRTPISKDVDLTVWENLLRHKKSLT